MMQQVASVKSESAASALPLDIAKGNASNSGTRDSFDNVFQQQANQPSAFEKAQKNARNNAVSNTETAAHTKAQSNVSDRGTRAKQEAQVQHNARDRTDKAQSNESERNKIETSDVETPSERENKSVAGEAAISDSEDQALANAANKDNASSDTSTQNKSAALSEDELKVTVDETLEAEQLNAEGFDYINFVSQFAEFTGTDAFIKTNELLSADVDGLIKNELGANLLSTDTKPNTLIGNELDSQKEGVNASNEAEEATLLQLGINKEQLQVILDAQNVQLDLSGELNQQELLKLQAVIADMLNQLAQSEANPATSNQNELEQIKLADQALLESVLLSPKNADSPAQNRNQDSLEKLNLDTVDKLNTRNGTDKVADAPALIEGTPDDIKSGEELAEIKVPSFATRISESDTWRTMPDLSNIKPIPDDKIKPDIVKAPIGNIVELNDEQTKLAVNSLNERLQTVVSELKTEGKGNEFAAALQSGMKEFKQQLAQGREPGISLKDMVSEALASANIDTEKSVQPKIDAAINQLNAVLNLANAVNYSPNQQPAYELGLSDKQLVKEINHQHIEGTKLANAVNNQMNNDKAINIFKAEGQTQLAEKVRWMVNARNPSAEIRLDPPDLGAVNIKINLSGDIAQVNFTVQSMGAKEALDQAVPRLRDMLQQQGIELGQSSVQQDSRGDQNAQQQGEFAESGQSNGGANGEIKQNSGGDDALEAAQDFAQGVIEQRISGATLGGIDYYA